MGNAEPILALQPLVQLFLQGMQVQNVRRCIIELGRGQRLRTPIGRLLLLRLLLLGNLHPDEFPHEVLEAMPVRIGAHQS
jgi:hypothetical protein